MLPMENTVPLDGGKYQELKWLAKPERYKFNLTVQSKFTKIVKSALSINVTMPGL